MPKTSCAAKMLPKTDNTLMEATPTNVCTLLWGTAHASHLQVSGWAAVVWAWDSICVPSSHKYDVIRGIVQALHVQQRHVDLIKPLNVPGKKSQTCSRSQRPFSR